MYSYEWDAETGGILLNSSPMLFSKEPRPVYYKELDILGFDKYWNYEKNDAYPYMWAEANNYYYRGRLVAKTKGGSLYTAPEIVILDSPEPNGQPLRFIDVPEMVHKNEELLEVLSQSTIKKIYNTYIEYKNKVDVFYVAFSGGKDSIVALDLVQRALPHNQFKVLFGDTGMEFPDTYKTIEKVQQVCKDNGVEFLHAKSKLPVKSTWACFGPPSVTNRWCCSVHKTSPQIMLLQEKTGIVGFIGMAFTGVRADESLARSEYDDVSLGRKHKGQFSCHPIIEWNTAELFLYIFSRGLYINESYKKGNCRAGCLICPMSSGKHEYMKNQCYPDEVAAFVDCIRSTSGKSNFSDDELTHFIDDGNWKTRKTGRELNFGSDKHSIDIVDKKTEITVYTPNHRWKEWAKTIGSFTQLSENRYSILFNSKDYEIELISMGASVKFVFPNADASKNDIKFLSLFRSVIIKSIYCVNCGVCVAECPSGCIDMTSGVHISDNCQHCYRCHDVHEHCLRYNSIRNKIGEDRKVKGMDRYYSFGIRKSWVDIFFSESGSDKFWNTDGRGMVPNKKKDAFLNFVKDAGLTVFSKSSGTDKYTKNIPSPFGQKLFEIGSDSDTTWALMLCNLAYTSEFNWFVKNITQDNIITPDMMRSMLEEVMEGDAKGLGKRNICDAFKIMLIKTPFGKNIGLGICDYDEKTDISGNEKVVLNSFRRTNWKNPEPRVILYALYKFAEACGDYYQFTLSRLLDHDIESNGISPTEIFGLDRETMERILNGLTINYPDYITASFTLDLDNITLRSDKTSQDVLNLF